MLCPYDKMSNKASDKNKSGLFCPLCGSASVSKEMECRDYFVSGETFPVYSCSKCTFHFTVGAPSDDEIGRYYKSADYISHSDTERGVVNKLYHLVRDYMLKEKCTYVTHFTGKKTGRLLDYGCGTGYFSNKMMHKGWKVEAIEKSEDARTFAFEHFGIRSNTPAFMENIAPSSFDCITLWHVMEHLSDMHTKMDQFYELLDKNGLLIMAVPNRTSYDARHYGEHWAAYDVPRHLWHFSPSTMLQLGNDHGFVLVEMIPMPFDAFYISMMSEKYKGSKIPFLKGVMQGIAAWFSTLGKRERSSSLIYVFKK